MPLDTGVYLGGYAKATTGGTGSVSGAYFVSRLLGVNTGLYFLIQKRAPKVGPA